MMQRAVGSDKKNIVTAFSTTVGRAAFSFLLGMGIASLFKKVCRDDKCLVFKGPMIDQIEGKVYNFDDHCFEYDIVATTCDPDKDIIPFADKTEDSAEITQPPNPKKEDSILPSSSTASPTTTTATKPTSFSVR